MQALTIIVNLITLVGVIWYTIKGFKVTKKQGFKNLIISLIVGTVFGLVVGGIGSAILE